MINIKLKKVFLDGIKAGDSIFKAEDEKEYELPSYDPKTHYLEITRSKYFRALVFLRHNIKKASDLYWGDIQGASNIDLFMLTSSVSSPMGPGSNSEAVSIKFGDLKTFLVDSSQFGFEPILMNGFQKVYCYLPSMRGENPDKRHLNQFYHCEAEIVGTMDDLIPQIEGYVKFLAETLLQMKNTLRLISVNSQETIIALENLIRKNKFDEIEFEDAANLLKERGFSQEVNETKHGKDMTSLGELKVLESIDQKMPIWFKNFDRDRVAFYQKPHKNNADKVINADLIFPNIIKNSFGGEIVGCGQRQNNYEEMLQSLKRQGIDPVAYEWYLNLRKMPNYKTTSGFGIGIERFIAWALCREDIKDVILYPRLKNTIAFP